MPVRIPIFVALQAGLAAAAMAAEPPAPGFRYWDPEDTAAAPRTLSATGLYETAPGPEARMVPAARFYEVNAPSWSDGARQRRWVLLKPGRSIGFREKDDYWDYPDSAVFIKEFAIDTVPGDTASRVIWETRFLIGKKMRDPGDGSAYDGWFGFSYQWRKDQSDADLVSLDKGKRDSLRVWPAGAGPGKASYQKKWSFPNVYECAHCHHSGGGLKPAPRSVLGFFTAQLNRAALDGSGLNQLDRLFQQGVLRGQNSLGWDYSPRWRGIGDGDATLDLRARSYLAANCSNCHGARGAAAGLAIGTYLDFDFHDMSPRMEMRHFKLDYARGLDKVPPFFYARNDPANPQGVDTLPIVPALAVPGYPGKSILPLRLRARDTLPGDFNPDMDQMPPMATYEVDKPAVALIEEWIRKMPEPVAGLARFGKGATGGVRLQGRLLRIDRGHGMPEAAVGMVSPDGRKVALRRLASGTYEIPAGTPKGLYLIRIGPERVLRFLL